MAIYNWNATTGYWNNGDDWIATVNGVSVNGVPGAGDTADIASGDVTVTAAIAAGAIKFSGGIIDLGVGLAYAGAFSESDGATLDLDGHALTLSGSNDVLGGDINGLGTVKITGSTALSNKGTSEPIYVSGGATIEDAGSVTQQGGLYFNGTQTGGELLIDASATYAITGIGASINGGLMVNNGALTIGAGDELTSSSSVFVNLGSLNVAAGGKLLLNGNGSDTLSGAITGAGTLEIGSSATATLTTGVAFGAIAIDSGGVLNFGLSLSYAGAFTDYYNGTFSVNGQTLTLTGSKNFLDGDIQGFGTVKVTGAAVVSNSGSGRVTYVNGDATIEDAGAMTQQGGLYLTGSGTGSGELLIDQTATYAIKSSGASVYGGVFINNGALSIAAGDELKCTSGIFVNLGSLNVDLGGRLLLSGNGSDTLSGAITGAGTLEVGSSATATLTTSVAFGAIAIDESGDLNFGLSLVYAGVFSDYYGGALNVGGQTLTLSGAKDVLDGEVEGFGTVKVTGAAVVSNSGTGRPTYITGGATVEDAGAMTQQGGIYFSGIGTGGGELLIDQGATYSIKSTGASLYGGEFFNNGALTLGAGADLSLTNNIYVDNGTVTLGSGAKLTLGSGGVDMLEGSITGAGAIVVAGATATITTSNLSVGAIDISSGTLALDAAVSSSETFHYQGSSELILGDLTTGGSSQFQGTIAGFASGDSFDAVGFGTGTTFAFAENSAKTGGVLTLTDGSTTANINFLGKYSHASFSAAVGSNDTLFTF